MSVALVTGASGLIGSAAVRFFAAKGFDVVGIDNDLRAYFFGPEASTQWAKDSLLKSIPNYVHHDLDIRDESGLEKLFRHYGKNFSVIIHAAAQPSHDWAAKEPLTDFTVNANGTLLLLENTRRHASDAVFIFTSTNKVYGDTPNDLPLIEKDTRFEISPEHPFAAHGIDETMSVDQTLHSLFGAGKVAADILVQEYGRYFGLKTASFRGGCLTGSGHSGAELHGFLAYLVRCCLTGRPYTVFGYHGKQVRDNIHAEDLIQAFWHFYQAPRVGEVYNIGGSRFANVSMKEAIDLTEKITEKTLQWTYQPTARVGDHQFWVSDVRKFQSHYPSWQLTYSIEHTLKEIAAGLSSRLS